MRRSIWGVFAMCTLHTNQKSTLARVNGKKIQNKWDDNGYTEPEQLHALLPFYKLLAIENRST